MKNIFTILVLACITFASCTDKDDFGNGKFAANVGDKIVFGSSMNFESNDKQTRTVYGDKKPGENGYTEIKWYIGDHVRIYCDQTVNTENEKVASCDYVVTGDDVIGIVNGKTDYTENPFNDKDANGNIIYDEQHSVGLEVAEGQEAMCWGSDETHQFFGVYPSPVMLNKGFAEDADVAASIVKNDEGGITASLPNIQRPSRYVAAKQVGTGGKKHYVIHPAMRYAYMVAQASGNTDNGVVEMLFKPIVTAVEMSLVNTGENVIEGVSMVSLTSKSAISGTFKSDFGATIIEPTSTDPSNNVVSIPLYHMDNNVNKPISFEPGDTITFTAFLMPNTHLDQIGVTLMYAEGAAMKSATLKGNDVNIIQKQRKNFISNVTVNFETVVKPVTMSNWMSQLPNESVMSGLSIPAAGGATSGQQTNKAYNVPDKYREQDLSIDGLWAQGIRCFEFTVDRLGSDKKALTDLGDAIVYCNAQPTGVDLATAVQLVKDNLIENPTEFAMVIITYQSNSGWETRDGNSGAVTNTTSRDPAAFMVLLDKFWEEISKNDANKTIWPEKEGIKTGTKLYSAGITVAESRGQLFCIARPTSEGEDNYVQLEETDVKSGTLGFITLYTNTVQATYPSLPAVATSNNKILVINGWGALKDKWDARGYTKCIFKRGIGNNAYNNESTEYDKLGIDNKPGRPFDTSNSGEEVDFSGTLPAKKEDGTGFATETSDLALSTNFYYSTSTVSQSGRAWVQEWARVSKNSEYFTLKACTHDRLGSCNKDGGYVYWLSSLQEKKNNILETLKFSLAKKINDDDASGVIFINSLCGYYIGNDDISASPNSLTESNIGSPDITDNLGRGVVLRPLTEASDKSGMSGDIANFAKDINDYFYTYLLQNPLESGKSTGIIMMDRVSDDNAGNPAGYYIPRIIIANNTFVESTNPASAVNVAMDDNFDPKYDNLAAPGHRSALCEDEEISIIWH